MASIFISYRREDSFPYARALCDRLRTHFGTKHQVFMDVDTLDPGVDFVEKIEQTVGSCDVLIAVIGKLWLTAVDEQARVRIKNPEDFVRLEIQTALTRKIRVIPTLVGGARMPVSQDLPSELAALARRNAFQMHDDSFDQSTSRLIESLEEALAEAPARGELERRAVITQEVNGVGTTKSEAEQERSQGEEEEIVPEPLVAEEPEDQMSEQEPSKLVPPPHKSVLLFVKRFEGLWIVCIFSVLAMYWAYTKQHWYDTLIYLFFSLAAGWAWFSWQERRRS